MTSGSADHELRSGCLSYELRMSFEVVFFFQIACFSLKFAEVINCLRDVVVDVIQTTRVSTRIGS